jgi:broad specificity phosphatase PhoE
MNNTYFGVRHGSTADNEAGIFMGHLDTELSQKGIQEACSLRNYIDSECYNLAFTSPLKRARTTARIALGILIPEVDEQGNYFLPECSDISIPGQFPLIQDNRLKERDFGDLTGTPKKRYLEQFPQYAGINVTKSFTE